MISKSRIKAVPAACIPSGWRIYAIGDIHGRLDLLDQLLKRIEADRPAGPNNRKLFIFLGDYIDRGPSSKGVIDRILALRSRQRVFCLKGNHEAFLDEFLAHPESLQEWGRYGGLNTLMSYGLRPPLQPNGKQCVEIASELARHLPETHIAFLRDLGLSLTCGDFFFVHAGVRPHIDLNLQNEDDLLWIREDFLLHEEMFEKIVVHGHTPVREPEVFANRVNIDTGAYATGRLTCLVLEGDQMRFL